jgi:mono/diheme cytochrome c family protein
MRRRALLMLALLIAGPSSGGAQQPEAVLDDTEQLGRRLFVQSCAICHLKPQITAAALYGPALSKDSAGGREDVMRQVIGDGTPRMPGFKYQYDSTQIAAIVAYLKTVPAPATPR